MFFFSEMQILYPLCVTMETWVPASGGEDLGWPQLALALKHRGALPLSTRAANKE
jgi:hypothetical protein